MNNQQQPPAAPGAAAAAGQQQQQPGEDLLQKVGRFKFPTFDPKAEEWRYWIRRFDMELELQGLTAQHGNDNTYKAARRNLILKSIGPELYRLVVDHFEPTPIGQKFYSDVKEFLNGYFKPSTNYLLERMKFGQCFRKSDQTVS